MTDESGTTSTDAAGADTQTDASSQSSPETQVDETDWKAEARKWEQRAKENNNKAKEFDQQRKAAMTDAERAVVEAEERGRTAAATDFGKELAQTQFDALAGRRNPGYDTAKALKRLDMSSLLDENGRPDPKEIEAAVMDLVPEPSGGPTSFDGGARTATPTTDFNQILRKAAGRA